METAASQIKQEQTGDEQDRTEKNILLVRGEKRQAHKKIRAVYSALGITGFNRTGLPWLQQMARESFQKGPPDWHPAGVLGHCTQTQWMPILGGALPG